MIYTNPNFLTIIQISTEIKLSNNNIDVSEITFLILYSFNLLTEEARINHFCVWGSVAT